MEATTGFEVDLCKGMAQMSEAVSDKKKCWTVKMIA
jgi:hypothetical protein